MILREITFVGSKKVDREAGIIRGVRILGKQSKNGRDYSDKSLAEAAKLYAGVEVNVNHPDRKSPNAERKIEDGFGWIESVEVKADGVYGDLHYLKEHPAAGLVAEAAERNPKRFGLSHNAEGKVGRKDGKNVVESIQRVISVDLVQNPATNAGLFESTSRTIREVLEQHDPAFVKLLEDGALLPPEDFEDQPLMPDDGTMKPEGQQERDPASEIKGAIVALITAAMEGSDDEAAMLQKCALIIAARQAIINGMPKPEEAEEGEEEWMDHEPDEDAEPGEEPAAEPGAGESNNPFAKKEKPMAEGTTKKSVEERLQLLESENKMLREKNELNELEKHCTTLLVENKREVLGIRLTQLARLDNDEQRLLAIEDWPAIHEPEQAPQRRAKPAFSLPLREAKTPDAKYPADIDSFVEQCR